MSSESYDIRDRIVECAIEFREHSEVVGLKIKKLKGDKKALTKFLKEDQEDQAGFMNRFFSLVDEYIAINGGKNNN